MQAIHATTLLCVAIGCGRPIDVADEVFDDVRESSDIHTDPGSRSESETESIPEICEGLSAEPGDVERTIQVGDYLRSYTLHIPSTYKGDAPVPLVVDYHAIGGSGRNQLEISLYPDITDPEGVIMAFPDGLPGPAGTSWNLEVCCVDDLDGVDDIAFSKEMVADIGKAACIDRSRVYAVGRATGGGMAYHLACRAADVFAAVAPAGFDLIRETVDGCVPTRPITVVSFRGTANQLRPYDGGLSNVVSGQPITLLGAVNTFDTWAALNQCTGAISDVENGCRAYLPPQCEGDAEVWLCTIEGGETQPGDPTIAWPILKSHALP